MKLFRFCLLFACIGLSLVLFTGCDLFNPGGDDDAMSVFTDTSPRASVKFNIVLPPTKNRGSVRLSSLRPSSTGDKTAKVTFKILIGNPGNKAKPSYTLEKTVDVADGAAEASFDSVPAKPIIGAVKIDDGHLSGYSDFIGAKDLEAGPNDIELVPTGSGMAQEVVAKIVQTTIQSPDLIENAPEKLVGTAQVAASQVNLESAEAFNDALSSFLEQVKPPTYVYMTQGDPGEILRGYKNSIKTWTRTSGYFEQGELWGTDLTQMAMYKVLRQGLEGFGFVSFKHNSKSPFGIVRINTEDGSRAGYVANPGICNHAVVLSDGSIIVGGTNDDKRCPVLFRWNGSGEALTESNAQDEKNLTWARYFTEFAGTTKYPSPAVEGLTYDGQTLFCTVWDPTNEMQRTFRIDIATGEGATGFTGAVVNSLPFVTLESPAEGAVFTTGSDVNISASAYDTDGSVAKVEFYQGETLLGEKTAAPYTFTIANIQNGSYAVFAKAYDDKDGIRVSNTRTFEVKTAATIGKPVVVISSPSSGQIGVSTLPNFTINVSNGGENHVSTDWEVYANADLAATNLVWSKANDTLNRTSITLGADTGTFANALAGKTALVYRTGYWVRARARNSTDDSLAGEWSNAIFFTVVGEPDVGPNAPSVVNPAANSTDAQLNPTLTSSAFSDPNPGNTHLRTDWEVYTDPNMADGTRVWYKLEEPLNKTSIVVDATKGTFENALAGKGYLSFNTSYYARVRYIDSTYRAGEWSAISKFTTVQTYATYNITVTPAMNKLDLTTMQVLPSSSTEYDTYFDGFDSNTVQLYNDWARSAPGSLYWQFSATTDDFENEKAQRFDKNGIHAATLVKKGGVYDSQSIGQIRLADGRIFIFNLVDGNANYAEVQVRQVVSENDPSRKILINGMRANPNTGESICAVDLANNAVKFIDEGVYDFTLGNCLYSWEATDAFQFWPDSSKKFSYFRYGDSYDYDGTSRALSSGFISGLPVYAFREMAYYDVPKYKILEGLNKECIQIRTRDNRYYLFEFEFFYFPAAPQAIAGPLSRIFEVRFKEIDAPERSGDAHYLDSQANGFKFDGMSVLTKDSTDPVNDFYVGLGDDNAFYPNLAQTVTSQALGEVSFDSVTLASVNPTTKARHPIVVNNCYVFKLSNGDTYLVMPTLFEAGKDDIEIRVRKLQ